MKSKFLCLITAITICLGSALAAETSRPNIIFILADDLGWTDTGTYGSKFYETPNIDKLAAQGVKFFQHHHSPNCQPCRAALLTGQYSPRTGVYTVGSIDRFNWRSRSLQPVNNKTSLPLDKITIAQQLKQAGYATAMFGKWHLGEGAAYHPAQRGFDTAIVCSTHGHFDFKTNPPTEYPEGQYLADYLTDRAERFIRDQKDGPFFLYLPQFAVHSPFQAQEEDQNRFAEKAPTGGHHNPTYAGMVYAVDRSVGRIMALLDELKIADNTVLIFSSDNGGVGGYDRPDGLIRDAQVQDQTQAVRNKNAKEGKSKAGTSGGDIKGVTDNAPLRSGKGSLYEGGTRVPLVVRWPGIIQPGTICEVPTIHVDIYPSLLEIASAPQPKQVLDGETLVPLLKNTSAKLQRPAIYQHFPGYLGSGPGRWRTTPVGTIQAGEWKLMEFFEDQHLELYNLTDDPGENHNLAETMPAKTQELLGMLKQWRKEIQAPMPTKNKPSNTKPRR